MTNITTQAREMIERQDQLMMKLRVCLDKDIRATTIELDKWATQAAALIGNLLAEREARENITDELQASQYRAGAQAGWNAAQLIWPKSQEAIARMTNVNKGDLKHIQSANSDRKAKEA